MRNPAAPSAGADAAPAPPLTREVLMLVSVLAGCAAIAGTDSPAGGVVAAAGMVRVAGGTFEVGTSLEEREVLAARYRCVPTWLNDDLPKRTVDLADFWIDRTPVTNAQYRTFVLATGARAPWPGGVYPADLADHPVVNVPQHDAAGYAQWLGKRLPTAEEWEVASRGAEFGLYPWGDEWPAALGEPAPASVDFTRPGTAPVGTGRHGRSASGMEDFVQQVTEWTATRQPHHGTQFHRVKGASWLHRDPVNFRTAATSTALMSYTSPLIGFRCALDGRQTPPALPPVPASPGTTPVPATGADQLPLGPQVYALADTPAFLAPHVSDWNWSFLGNHAQHIAPNSRGFLLVAPELGSWPVCLFLGEAVYWSGERLLGGLRSGNPALRREAAAGSTLRYRLDLAPVALAFEFVRGADYIDLRTEITNRTEREGTYSSSSCFALNNHPLFYDADMTRTYLWSKQDGFVLMRDLPRAGECVRWIQPSDLSRHGGAGVPGMMAVTSRDGRWTFASVRFELERPCDLRGNTWLNCLHTDADVVLPPGATRRTLQRLYFLRGDLRALEQRVQADLRALGSH